MIQYFFSIDPAFMNRILLSLLFLGIFSSKLCTAQEIKEVSNQELLELMENNEVQVVDVRTSREVLSGKIDGANNINFFDEDFKEKVGELDICKPVAVYCLKGKRSAQAAQVLTSIGFMEIYNLTNGYGGWVGAQYPIAVNEDK